MPKKKKQPEFSFHYDQYPLDRVMEHFIKDFKWGRREVIGQTEYFIDPIQKVVIFKTLAEDVP